MVCVMINLNAIAQWLQTLNPPETYLIVFGVLLVCGLGVPIPEDITLIAGGLMAYYQKADVHLMTAVGLLGVLIGDGFMFYLGGHYGKKVLKWKFFQKLLHPERMEAVQANLKSHGNKVIFSARFMPGLRSLVFFTAGSLHVPFRVFLFYDGLAALLSVPAIVYSCYFFGDKIDTVFDYIRTAENGILIAIGSIIAILVIRYYVKKYRKKNEEKEAA